MPADILLYALVAAGLVFWLRNILGTRHEDEPQRPNPFTARPAEKESGGEAASSSAQPVAGVVPLYGQNPEDMKAGLDKTMDFADTAAAGLMEIARHDRSFDLARFLAGSQDAFVMIVECFAEGDRETLKDLLSPSVYDAFEKVIADREEKGETASVEIHAVRRSEVIEAGLQGREASITVRFIADETNVLKDAEDNVLSGNPDRVTETIDIWTFSRNIKSRDPAWRLVATRDEDAGEGDHKTVPDGDPA